MAPPFATSLTLDTPAGVGEGDLLIATIALTYAPSLGTSPVAPGNVAVIIPADTDPVTGWTTILADYPGGNNNMGDQGSGLEEDRVAVFKHIVTAAEAAVPVHHTFNWTGSVCAGGVIKAFSTDIPTFSPSVYGAAATTIAANAGNPMNVVAPSMTPAETGNLLLCIYVARNGLNPAPGGSTFSTPAGMTDVTPTINMQTNGLTADPLGLAMFIETVTALPTGTRTSVVTQDNVPSNPFKGMGYSLLISGCTEIPVPPGPPPPR